MWISRKDWNELLEIQRTAIKAFEEWQATHAAQLKVIGERQDRLRVQLLDKIMQSHAALEKQNDAKFYDLAMAVGRLDVVCRKLAFVFARNQPVRHVKQHKRSKRKTA